MTGHGRTRPHATATDTQALSVNRRGVRRRSAPGSLFRHLQNQDLSPRGGLIAAISSAAKEGSMLFGAVQKFVQKRAKVGFHHFDLPATHGYGLAELVI